MPIRPTGHRVLVQTDVIEMKTASGIVLAVDEKMEIGAKVTGTVLAIGPTAYSHPDLGGTPIVNDQGRVIAHKSNPWIKVGDKVYWAKYAGKRVVDPSDPLTETKEKVLILLNDEEIVGVIE